MFMAEGIWHIECDGDGGKCGSRLPEIAASSLGERVGMGFFSVDELESAAGEAGWGHCDYRTYCPKHPKCPCHE